MFDVRKAGRVGRTNQEGMRGAKALDGREALASYIKEGRERLIDAEADLLPEEDEWRECLVSCASLPRWSSVSVQ